MLAFGWAGGLPKLLNTAWNNESTLSIPNQTPKSPITTCSCGQETSFKAIYDT